MKAVVCQNTQLTVADLPEPVPGPGQVLVAVERCGICDSDLHFRHHCDPMKSLLDVAVNIYGMVRRSIALDNRFGSGSDGRAPRLTFADRPTEDELAAQSLLKISVG